MKQLEEIKARASAASAGPWDFGTGYSEDGERQSISKSDKADFLALSLNDNEAPLWVVDNAEVIPAVTGDGPSAQANAAFIAAARSDVPKLVAALEAVTARLDEWASYKAFPDADDSQVWYSAGKRHASEAIRSIITEALEAA